MDLGVDELFDRVLLPSALARSFFFPPHCTCADWVLGPPDVEDRLDWPPMLTRPARWRHQANAVPHPTSPSTNSPNDSRFNMMNLMNEPISAADITTRDVGHRVEEHHDPIVAGAVTGRHSDHRPDPLPPDYPTAGASTSIALL